MAFIATPNVHRSISKLTDLCCPGDSAQLQSRVSACVVDFGSWMQSWVQLDTTKTEVLMWCAGRQIPG